MSTTTVLSSSLSSEGRPISRSSVHASYRGGERPHLTGIYSSPSHLYVRKHSYACRKSSHPRQVCPCAKGSDTTDISMCVPLYVSLYTLRRTIVRLLLAPPSNFTTQYSTAMSTGALRQKVNSYFEALASKDVDRISKFLSDDLKY